MTMSTQVLVGDSATDGTMSHTGRLIVSYRLPTGVVVKLTLPDDWQTLLARVAALETSAAAVPNSLEDLKYAG